MASIGCSWKPGKILKISRIFATKQPEKSFVLLFVEAKKDLGHTVKIVKDFLGFRKTGNSAYSSGLDAINDACDKIAFHLFSLSITDLEFTLSAYEPADSPYFDRAPPNLLYYYFPTYI